MAVLTKIASGAAVAAGAPFNGSWTNEQLARVATSDAAAAGSNTYATAAPGKNQEFASLWPFAFPEIPDNATVNSVTVKVQWKVSTTASVATLTSSAFADSAGAPDQAVAIGNVPGVSDSAEPTTDTDRTYTIPASVANLHAFWVRVQAMRGNTNTAYTASLDYIQVTADYTVPAFSTFERSAAIGATGAVASQGSFWSIFTGQSVVGATGLVASSGVRIPAPIERSAALSATAAIESIGHRVFLRSASLGASGAIASASSRTLQRSTGLGGNAGIASSGQSILERSAALVAVSALAASGQREVHRAAGMGAVAAIQSAAGTPAVHERSASLDAVTYFGVIGPNVLPRWISALETRWRTRV